MFWDKVSGLYDLFESVFNGKVYRDTGRVVAKEIEADDSVLECACGTGGISRYIAPICRQLVATDYSVKMLKTTVKNMKPYNNVIVKRADITNLKSKDEAFDKVVAGNVIHLLNDPYAALEELLRVCKTGGKVIIPTYITLRNGKPSLLVSVLKKAGAGFEREFDLDSYKRFFADGGYDTVEYHPVYGTVPCVVAILHKN